MDHPPLTGMRIIQDESRRGPAPHPYANVHAMPGSEARPRGTPEFAYARQASDVDVLGAIVVLNRLSGLRARTASFGIDGDGLATHASVGRTSRAFLTTIRIADGRLEIVDHAEHGPRATITIPWTTGLGHLPIHRETAASAIAAHARASVPLLEHSLRIRHDPGEGIEYDLRRTAGIVAACAATESDGLRLRLPSPWSPAALMPSDLPNTDPGKPLGPVVEAIADHLLPRTHAVLQEHRTDETSHSTVLGPMIVPVVPMDPIEAMRRIEGAVRVLGRRTDPTAMRALLDGLAARS